MSWFTSGLDTLSQLSEKVQKAIPVDKEFLAKLTLNTDEMKAERQQFGEDAKRKAEVKDMLAGMFPWETRDSERDILVEECKEAILALSGNEETFYGPFDMPQLKVNLKDEKTKEKGDEDAEEDGGGEEEGEEEVEAKKEHKPSAESLEKLAKLEPLPPLLRDFDLDSHVGLIQNLLKEDPVLEQRQSTLSGGGLREKVFWNNYFFHCAYTRYEAGLSIDEIWSFQPEATEAAKKEAAENAEEENSSEEVVVFDGEEGDEASTLDAAFVTDETSGEEGEVLASGVGETSNFVDSEETSPSGSAVSEFEMLEDGELDGGTGDPELDELEAEIARELED